MSNILNSGAQNANQATAPTPRVNDVPVGLPDGRNNFDMSFDNYLTARYGTILPFHFFQAYERDKVSFSSRHEVRSYTMAAPWMGSAYLHKHYFAVPMPALLRRNWQKIQVQPLKGEDVPQGANCVLTSNTDMLSELLAAFSHVEQATLPSFVLEFLKFFVAEYFFSPSSLVNLTGNAFYRNFASTVLNDYDNRTQTLLEVVFAAFEKGVKLTYSDRSYSYSSGYPNKNDRSIRCSSPYELFDIMRNDLSFISLVISDSASATAVGQAFTTYFNELSSDYRPTTSFKYNYQYALAYQCVCAQFYTNDHVDNLYTWELYEQAAQSILFDIMTDTGQDMPSFSYNGVNTLYDVFSGYNVGIVISELMTPVTSSTELLHFQKCCIFLQYLFGLHNSLVYGDYFHGAKTSPLAVVDVNSPVAGNRVSAIDVTKSIVMQRFGNAVQKAGQRFKDYVGAILGGSVSPDYHEPKWIVGNTFLLGANEIENTAEKQGDVVQNIRTSADNWVYETEFGMQSVVLGLFFFNTPSVYSRAIFRENMQVDRFDFFNPRLQNIGDQPVFRYELTHAAATDANFAYQTRNADMKQRFSIARGGFIGSLPAWSFSIDEKSTANANAFIDSDFIRDVPSSFDRFYSSLTGLTLANRFHMIFKFSNECHAARNMQITPTIL